MISTNLNDIFQKSILYAKGLRHEYLTIEHVFIYFLVQKMVQTSYKHVVVM